MYYSDEYDRELKNIITDFLEFLGHEEDCDDLFDIHMIPGEYYYKEYKKAWKREELDHSIWPKNPSDLNIIKFLKETGDMYENPDYPKWVGVNVISKSPESKWQRLALRIQEIL